MKPFYSLFFGLSLILFCSFKAETVVYVDASYQNKKMKGSMNEPFNSIDNVMEYLQKLKKQTPDAHIKVVFQKGTYTFKEGYVINQTLSNTTFTTANNEQVFFSGGIDLPIDKVKTSQNKLSMLSLKKLGIENYGTIHNIGFARPSLNSWMELFVNGKPMHLSRWPNHEMIKMGKIIQTGSVPRNNDFTNKGAIMNYDSARISSWKENEEMWMAGYFHHGYADDALRIATIDRNNKTIATDGPTLYGFNSSSPWNKWYAFNIKEETDEKGEFFIDKKKEELLFISPDSTIQRLVLSQLEKPFFTFDGVSNFRLENIVFEYSRAAILSLTNTENVQINRCVFRNSGQWAIIIGKGIEPFKNYLHEGSGKPIIGLVGSLDQHLYANQLFYREGGQNNTVSECDFYNLGAGGISLGGGNRITLEAGNNVISKSKFHDNNRIERSYRPHIYITGVGNKVIDCEIYNSPSMAILMHGNNHLIENNYIHHVVLEADDQGAFYYGRNPSECGTVIRKNVFAHIPDTYSTCAIYHDDGAGGLIVEDNIFYKAGRYAALIGGGSDNIYRNNTFIEMPTAFHIDNRLENWSKSLIQPNELFEKRLKEVNYNEGVYLSQYPYLKNYLPYVNAKPQRNLISNNRFFAVKQLTDHDGLLTFEKNQFWEMSLKQTK